MIEFLFLSHFSQETNLHLNHTKTIMASVPESETDQP